MKYLSLLFGLSITLITIKSLGQLPNTAIAKSIFWQAPYPTHSELKLIAQDTSIQKECDAHKKIMLSADGSPNFIKPDRIDFYRQLSGENSMESNYWVLYALSGNLNIEVTNEISNSQISKIPFYNQTTSITELDLNSLKLFNVVFSKDSLLEISSQAGLAPLPINLIYRNGKPYLKIQGRDTVCDLLDQKAKIQAVVTGLVRLPPKIQTELNEYYTKIESQTLHILSQNESQMAKTVRLGFRLSSLVSPELQYNQFTEEATLALFKLLFSENSLNFSNAWTKDLNQKPILMVFGTTVKSHIQLELSSEVSK